MKTSRKVLITLFLILMFMSSAGENLEILLRADLELDDASVRAYQMSFVSLCISSVAMMFIPFIARLIKKEKLSFKNGKRLCFWNSVILFVVPAVLEISLIGGVGAVLFYFINKWVFVKESFDNGNNMNVSMEHPQEEMIKMSLSSSNEPIKNYGNHNVMGSDIALEDFNCPTHILAPESDNIKSLELSGNNETIDESTIKQESKKNTKKKLIKFAIIILTVIILAVLFAMMRYIAVSKAEKIELVYKIEELEKTNKESLDKITELENTSKVSSDEIESLKRQVEFFREENEKLAMRSFSFESENYKEKAEFLDDNIVFVLDGYGNYYYTYDQVVQVTQGKSFEYWAYNIEAAKANGYRPWN